VGIGFGVLNTGVGAGALKLVGEANVAAGAGKLGAVVLLDDMEIPPLFAPFSFSCVRPNAAIPRTAPMAIWNNPAPCSDSGLH
jgi:hypothetical protein